MGCGEQMSTYSVNDPKHLKYNVLVADQWRFSIWMRHAAWGLEQLLNTAT